MFPRPAGALRLAAIALLVCSSLVATGSTQQPQVPGAIRTGITVVPLDVRVLDRNHKPITDLKQEEFRIEEDGIRQEIRFFSTQGLSPEPPQPGTPPRLRQAQNEKVAARNQRTFLIVLGRGRHQSPSRGTDALLQFVRNRLLPQDHVAVLGYNRASNFTTNHGQIAALLERYKRANDKIESMLTEYFSGLRAIYGSRNIPAYIQVEIDKVFRRDDPLSTRTLPAGPVADAEKLTDESRRVAEELKRREDARASSDALQRAAIVADRTVARGLTEEVNATRMIDLSFDEYVENYAYTTSELNNVYSGIEYLRYLEGEKHLVLVSHRGLFLPRLESAESIAALASDARVAIDTIHTGGTSARGLPSAAQAGPTALGRSTGGGPFAAQTAAWDDTFAVASLRNLSTMTGGQAALYQYADRGLQRVDEATRFQYLLGYSPTNTTWDGGFRRVKVTVTRPGATVLVRRGYYGRQQLVPYDRKRFVTYSRIAAAGNHAEPLSDIGVTIGKAAMQGPESAREAHVDATIDVSRVAFTEIDGRQVATLQVAVFLGDPQERLVGELWQALDLKLTPETHQRALKMGFEYSAKVAVTSRPSYAKVVVYDHEADLVGSAMAGVR